MWLPYTFKLTKLDPRKLKKLPRMPIISTAMWRKLLVAQEEVNTLENMWNIHCKGYTYSFNCHKRHNYAISSLHSMWLSLHNSLLYFISRHLIIIVIIE